MECNICYVVIYPSLISRRWTGDVAAMAAQFIGLTVKVSLSAPIKSQLQGVVVDVSGQQLTLRDGEDSRMRSSELVLHE